MADCSPTLTYGADRKSFDFAKLIDGNPGTVVTLPLPETEASAVPEYRFPEPFTAQACTWLWTLGTRLSPGRWRFPTMARTTGHSARNPALAGVLREFRQGDGRYFRIVLRPQGDWFFRQFANGIPLGEVELHAAGAHRRHSRQSAYIRQEDVAR